MTQVAEAAGILITCIDGVRYAVRHNSVAVIHDADEFAQGS